MTFTGRPQVVEACFYGWANPVNGVLFTNPIGVQIQHLRVYNLNGFGVQFQQMQDVLWDTISVELCGNLTAGINGFAFGVGPGSGTSSASHGVRLQVEQANAQAIFIDPTCIGLKIDSIHSERLTPNVSLVSWSLGGSRCQYSQMRFNASGVSANATLLLGGEHTEYNVVAAEGNIVVQAQGDSGSAITITTPDIAGTLINTPSQTGNITVVGGVVSTMTVDPQGIRALSVQIGTLTIGVGPNPADPTQARFETCDITTLVTGASVYAAATFTDCRIGEGNNLLKGWTILSDCQVTFAAGCTVQAPLYAKGTYFVGNLNTNGLAVFDDGCTLTGTASGSVAPTAGTWQTGQLTIDLSGASQGQQCTAGGSPGTWSAVGGALAHTLTIGTHLTGGSFNGSANITIATDAVSTNTASTIVARDGSGNFSIGTLSAVAVTVSGQGTFQRATDFGADSIQLGVQNSVTGGMRIWNSVASGEGQIYGDATYGIRMDTNGNARPIRIDGSALSVSSAANFLSTIQTSGNVAVGFTPLSKVGLYVATTVTAVSGNGWAQFINTVVAASANGDNLYPLSINPGFTPGAFTGLHARGLSILGMSVATFTSPADPVMLDIGVLTGTGATNAYGIKVAAPTGAGTNNLSIWSLGSVQIDGTLQLGSAYSAGGVVATGTIPIKDSSGTTYNVLVHT